MQFGTSVESVKPVATEKGWRGLAWDVTTSDVTGTLMHSHDYRCPEPFTGKSVLLLGAGLSGLDIAQELSAVTSAVTLSHSQAPLRSPLPQGMLEAPGVQRVLGDGALELGDGSLVRPDVFMFCTGYKFTFPFLEPGELGLQLRSHMVSPLYKHLLHTAFPSLSIVGLCRAICPFPHFHCQMDREVDTEIRRLLDSGVPLRHVLKLDAEQTAARLHCVPADMGFAHRTRTQVHVFIDFIDFFFVLVKEMIIFTWGHVTTEPRG
ncbi:UNVERIFIED_CONTAM: hypothetical protein FKN15_065645 [Acipenser sinensis]